MTSEADARLVEIQAEIQKLRDEAAEIRTKAAARRARKWSDVETRRQAAEELRESERRKAANPPHWADASDA